MPESRQADQRISSRSARLKLVSTRGRTTSTDCRDVIEADGIAAARGGGVRELDQECVDQNSRARIHHRHEGPERIRLHRGDGKQRRAVQQPGEYIQLAPPTVSL